MNTGIALEIEQYPLIIGQTNEKYEKIINCKVVKPTYEVGSFYKDKFFLDKRDGFTDKTTIAGYDITDRKTIDGNNFYLGNNGSLIKVFNEAGTEVAGSFTYSSTVPVKMEIGRGAGGPQLGSGTLTLDGIVVTAPTAELGIYSNAYIELEVGATYTIGNYIAFTSGILAGTINEIRYVSGTKVYILGTNVYGTNPEIGANYSILTGESETLLVGAEDGLYLCLPNGTSAMLDYKIYASPVQDIEEFNGVFFIMSGNNILYSRSTFDDNTGFYPLDFFKVRKPQKLISLGKMLILLGRENKVFTTITNTEGVIGYIMVGLQYNNQLYSKYSYVVFDSVFYILQDDRRLVQIDVIGISNTHYQIVGKDVAQNVKGMFRELTNDVRIIRYKQYLNFIEYTGSKTNNYQYDLEYQHWIIQEYGFKMNVLLDEALCNGKTANITSVQDFGIEYKQEINLALGEEMFNQYMIKRLRIILGTNKIDKIDFKLDTQHELDNPKDGPWIDELSFDINNMMFDTLLDSPPIVDDLIGYELVEPYKGNIVSVDVPIDRTGRYNRFKLSGEKRFILGGIFIFSGKNKSIMNNINI